VFRIVPVTQEENCKTYWALQRSQGYKKESRMERDCFLIDGEKKNRVQNKGNSTRSICSERG